MTYVAKLTLADEDRARRLALAVADDDTLGNPAVAATEVTPAAWEVSAYFETRPDRTKLRAAVAGYLGGHVPDIAIEHLPDQDWVASSLAGLAPVAAGRFLVHGAHDRVHVSSNRIGIEIEAGQAFGTGHHATTRFCLLMLERLARRRRIDNPLDLGTGSGVLAIAIAKLWRVPVIATDIDPVAIRVAAENARLNRVAGLVATAAGPGFAAPAILARAPYDLIVANILAGPLIALAPDFARHIRSGGTAILSGILESQRPGVLAAFRAHGFVFSERYVEDGWVTLRLAYRPAKRKGRRHAAPPQIG